MRRVAFSVPETVLTGHARLALAQATAAQGGVWFSADYASKSVSVEPQVDTKRRRRAKASLGAPLPLYVPTGATFLPAVASEGASLMLGPDGRFVLGLTAGVNGGQISDGPLACASTFSVAVIWAAGDEPAKTLFALRGPARGDNYLFLSEEAPGALILRDNNNTLRLEAALMPGQAWAVLVISVRREDVSFDGETDRAGAAEGQAEASSPEKTPEHAASAIRVGLALAGQPASFADGPSGLPEDPRLLLGCRAPREGMLKSLGDARISDLFYWPGVDLLDAGGARSQLGRAFDDFCLWEL